MDLLAPHRTIAAHDGIIITDVIMCTCLLLYKNGMLGPGVAGQWGEREVGGT